MVKCLLCKSVVQGINGTVGGGGRDTISREQVFTRCHRDRQSHETRYLVVCQHKATAVTWKRLNTVTIIDDLLLSGFMQTFMVKSFKGTLVEQLRNSPAQHTLFNGY